MYDVESRERKQIVSKHTDNNLEKLNLQIKFRGNPSDFREALDNRVLEVDSNNEVIKEYEVNNSSYSYSGQQTPNTIYSFNVDLVEVEDLNVEKLLIEDIELPVYEYAEEYKDDSLRIDAKAKVSYEKLDKLREIEKSKDYFEVVRQGISEEKKEMRFGKVVWSKHDEFTKHDMVLVEKSYDKGNKLPLPNDPELSNIMSRLAFEVTFLDQITDLLVSKEIISKDELDEIEEEASSKVNERKREFYLVGDIDNE